MTTEERQAPWSVPPLRPLNITAGPLASVRATVMLSMIVASAIACGPAPAFAQDGVGFRIDLGRQDLGRDWGDVLDGALDAEFALLYRWRGFRTGVGVNLTSMRMAGGMDVSWHHATGLALIGYAHPLASRLRVFEEVQYLRRTARLEGGRLFDDSIPTEPIGPFRATGNGVGARVGVEIALRPGTSVTLSTGYQWFSTRPDPLDAGLDPARNGTALRIGAGLTWFPGRRVPGRDRSRSADEASMGLALGVGTLGVFIPWTYNEYIKGKPFTAISPRSWRRGVGYGFGWDDNRFNVNYFQHPYHGQFYYNAARAAGFGPIPSASQALVGSYLWECCMETHPPSAPDMVTTFLGGAILGESLHRVSSSILDDSARGTGRIFREIAAALVNPARGIARVVTGDAWASAAPSSVALSAAAQESRLPSSGLRGVGPLNLLAGMRLGDRVDSDGRIVRPFFMAEWAEGDLFGPGDDFFAYQRLKVGFHPGGPATLGELTVRGSVWRSGEGSDGERSDTGPTDRFSAFLDLDYVDIDGYRWATNGVSAGWARARPLGERTELRLETDVSLVVLGSVTSPQARFAEIRGVRERQRLYDFGTGGGARLSVAVTRGARPWIEASYRTIALETLHGSNIGGSRSWHVVQLLEVGARQPLASGWGVGVDARLFVQDSHYGFADFADSSRHVPEARLYLSWRAGM